jgi:hypothetical protein
MFVHGHIPLGEAWGYLRDHLKPTTPYAAECLERARTYTPPSKAHVKRIKLRERAPLVIPARPRKPLDQSARLDHNDITSAHVAIERLVRVANWTDRAPCIKVHRPEPVKVYPPAPPPKSDERKDVDYADLFAMGDRKQLIELFKHGHHARLTPARVMRAFGTPDFFNGRVPHDFA